MNQPLIPQCDRCQQPTATILDRGPLAGQLLPVACACKTTDLREQQDRARRQDAAHSYQDNPVPRRFRDASLDIAGMVIDDFNREAVSAARAFVARMIANPSGETVKGLGLHGDKGTGKTHIAWAIANALRDRHSIPTLFFNMLQLSRLDKELFGEDKKRARFFRRLTTCPVLVLDDLGKEYSRDGGGYSDAFFYDVINARYENCLPLVITTNFSLPALLEGRKGNDRYIAALDRIQEMAGLQWIAVRGITRRIGG